MRPPEQSRKLETEMTCNNNQPQQPTAQELEATLGRSEAISQFVAECAVQIDVFAPEFEYRNADLSGFVRAAWPCEGTPVDVAAQFVETAQAQREE